MDVQLLRIGQVADRAGLPVKTVRALRAMDVPFSELGRILQVRCSGQCNCTALKTSIQMRIQSIDQRLYELVVMKVELAQLLSFWRDCGGVKSA